MTIAHNAVLLRIFIGEEDRYQGRVLYEAIVASALERKMAGVRAALTKCATETTAG
jgi:PII-like signaling protein